jgi:hydroxyethylthiazole kinase
MTLPTATKIAALHDAVRARRPLVQNITNYVAMTISANVLLALGASPAMVHAAEEVDEFAGIADALVVNIGTLSTASVPGMLRAARAYQTRRKPWVLDPVAAGATALRRQTAVSLLECEPTVVRGNAGEIMALAGATGGLSKGVDSLKPSDAAIEAAKSLATSSGAIVAVTGKVDYVTDGQTIYAIEGGHALMPLSTAIGCALSAVTAAFAAAAPPLDATVAALAVYKSAGAVAGARCPRGPGHLPAELCDALYGLDEAMIAVHASVQEVTA